MLSYTCKTAVKAVLFLASQNKRGEKAGIKEIANHINASEHTVGKMLQTLVKQNVVNSLKGPAGGFYVTEAQQHQNIINIVYAIDGKQVFSMCGLGLSKCSATHPCPIHNQYKEARNIIETIFKTHRVIDLCMPVNEGMAYLFG